MDSDSNSDITVFNTISQFSNSDIEIPDELAKSEPSSSTFSQPPFDPLTPNPQMIPPVPFLMIPKQPRHTLPLPMTVPTIIPQKPRKSHKN